MESVGHEIWALHRRTKVELPQEIDIRFDARRLVVRVVNDLDALKVVHND